LLFVILDVLLVLLVGALEFSGEIFVF